MYLVKIELRVTFFYFLSLVFFFFFSYFELNVNTRNLPVILAYLFDTDSCPNMSTNKSASLSITDKPRRLISTRMLCCLQCYFHISNIPTSFVAEVVVC